MELFKKKDRKVTAADMLRVFRNGGAATKHIGEWDKWKEIETGRIQVKIDVYEIKTASFGTAYLVADSFGRVAAQLVEDKQEVLGWLKEHGYKTDKRWYIEEAGMSEELWNAWNNAEDI